MCLNKDEYKFFKKYNLFFLVEMWPIILTSFYVTTQGVHVCEMTLFVRQTYSQIYWDFTHDMLLYFQDLCAKVSDRVHLF